MRGRNLRGVWLMLAVSAIAPARLSAQQYAPADPQVPLPYGSTRPEDGGFYTYGRALLYRQSNPLRQQQVAVRGLFAYETGEQIVTQIIQGFSSGPAPIPPGTIPDTSQDTGVNTGQALNGQVVVLGGVVIALPPTLVGIPPPPTILGRFYLQPLAFTVPGLFDSQGFVGSHERALDVQQLRTRSPYQPGMELGVGWKFRDGSSVSLGWKYLTEVQHRAGATLAPPAQFNNPQIVPGQNFENTFLFAPVYNFPPEYAGADFKVRPPQTQNVNGQNLQFPALALALANINPQSVFGIWNGASIMTMSFQQHFQQGEICYREPVWETETYRVNGLVGPRYTWFWEKFKWTTTSIGQNPDGTVNNDQGGVNLDSPVNVGIYSNITSNRMYGVFVGCEQEWYLGHGIAVQLRTDAALFMDSAKEKAKYETAAKYLNIPTNKRTKVEWSMVPELQANLGLMWYPTEFVQLYGGYDLMGFFNTRASPRPIDFDYSNINPRWTNVTRFIDGWNAGIAFTF
ncbi:MAG: Lpg1974 family pore-forming outer membrane protein [Gemmataceae bacterium]